VTRGRLSVFAKAPTPGRVKTRLAPPLSLEQAALLYDAMLADVLIASLDFARRLGLAAFLYFDPPEALAELRSRAPSGFELVPQVGAGLAERMANAFAQTKTAGCPLTLLRGSDSPALDFESVEQALEQLERGADLVLTPDQSGGYALIGMKEPRSELFAIALSTDSVLSETVSRARSLGLAVALTKPTFDLDVVADLDLVEALPLERSSVLCPRTVEFLAALRHSTVL
jgi:rSAM/selenodomain-associated transferase 1